MTRGRSSAPFTERWENFDLRIEGRVATVTLTRPEKLNALSLAVYADLRDLLAELHQTPEVAVLVITGSGRGFCSGGDVDDIIGALQGKGASDLLDFTRLTGAVVQGMRELPMPIIAAVNGVAAGAGAVIALAADLRLLAESASFHFLFTKVGLAGADMGAAYLLPRVVGLGRATELLLLGDKVDSGRAADIGLATAVVPDALLMEEAAALAARLASGPTLAYAATKSLVTRELDMGLSAAIEAEAYAQALLMASEDHAEFYRAYREGREPTWEGR
ncbi:MAG TPA: enoyl-CoA hydratase family protein [Acidimicrobiia bacterium]